MIKKSLNIALTIAVSCIALLCVGCLIGSWISGIHDVDNSTTLDAMNEINGSSVAGMDVEESYVFRSMEDYISYMSESNGVIEIANEVHATLDIESCFVPTNLPDDATLDCIEVGTEGTLFTYSLNRRDGSIVYDEDDLVIYDLLHTMRAKVYTHSRYNFITDQHEYCRNLATAIGATPVNGSNEHYRGLVYAYTRNEMGAYEKVLVGRQELVIMDVRGGSGTSISSIGDDVQNTLIPDTSCVICYYYYPITVSAQEAVDFVNSMEALVIE